LQGERNLDQSKAPENRAPLLLEAGKARTSIAAWQMRTEPPPVPPGERAVEIA